MKFKDIPTDKLGNKFFEDKGYKITITKENMIEVSLNGKTIDRKHCPLSDDDKIILRQTMGSGELNLDVNDQAVMVRLKNLDLI